MTPWYEEAVFYHMYPIGMTGAPRENREEGVVHRFEELEKWLPHIRELGCTAIYIGPLFESTTHGYDTRDYKRVDRRLHYLPDAGPPVCNLWYHSRGWWTACSTTQEENFLLFRIFRGTGRIPLTGIGTKASISGGTARTMTDSAMRHGETAMNWRI